MVTSDRSARGLIVRKPLSAFFVLSYAFFWLFLILFIVTLGLFRLKPNSLPAWIMPLVTIIGSWMPTVAAVVVTAILEGASGIGRLFRKFIQFKISAKWYLAALLPLGLALLSAGIYLVVAGGRLPSGINLSPSFWVGLTIINLLEGPTGEEMGWRGFALPRLLERYSPLKAGILLGLLWGFWHLPLWINTGLTSVNLLLFCLFFILAITSLSVLMTWIFCRTSNSLAPMTLAHFSFNAGFILFGSFIPTLPFFGIVAALLLVTTIVVWAAGGVSDQTAS